MLGLLACSPIPRGSLVIFVTVHEFQVVSAGDRDVLETAEDYDALIDASQIEGAPDADVIDFEENVVFTNGWVSTGCLDGPTYQAWVEDRTLWAHAEPAFNDCEDEFLQLDLLVADRAGVDDFAWYD